jgi:hypothetical protein
LDNIVSQSQNLRVLVEALNDESVSVCAAAMAVLSRISHYDTLHIMPILRLTMKRLIKQLQFQKTKKSLDESVQLVQSMVRGSNTLIVPYVSLILNPLLMMLEEQSFAVVGVALSTIGDLAVASPVSVKDYLYVIFPKLIEALNDNVALGTSAACHDFHYQLSTFHLLILCNFFSDS